MIVRPLSTKNNQFIYQIEQNVKQVYLENINTSQKAQNKSQLKLSQQLTAIYQLSTLASNVNSMVLGYNFYYQSRSWQNGLLFITYCNLKNENYVNQLFLIIFYIQTMGNPNLNLDLSSLVQSLASASILLYEFYGVEIRAIGLLLLAVFSFKLGRKSVVDPLEEEVKKMRFILETREDYTIVIPNKIKSLGNKIQAIFIILIIGTIGYFTLKQLKPEVINKIDVQIFILVGALLLLVAILIWLYQLLLKFKVNRGQFNDHFIIEKLGAISKMLGTKAQLLLQYFLCKEAYNRYKSRPVEGCNKQKCKQYRILLDEKARGVAELVNNALNFQWCAACKKRLPFDQYLDFQATEFHQKHLEDLEEEVNLKNNYLLKQVEKMAKWIKDVGPCNCSMRYWYQSKKDISIFKKREKELDPKIAMFQAKK